MATNRIDDDIDYTPEGATPPDDNKKDPTDAGYDEAAHSPGAYGLREGKGGVFGTTGGGTYGEGMHVEERDADGRPDDEGEK